MKEILRYLKPYKYITALEVFIKFIATFADLILPLIMAYIIDNCVATSNYPLIIKLGLLMLFVSLFGLVTNIVANQLAARISQNYARDLRNNLFKHSLNLSFNELDIITTPSLITRLTNDVNNVQNMILQMLRIVIRAPILFFGGLIMSAFIDPVLTLVMFITAPLLLVIIIYTKKLTIPIYEKVQYAIDNVILVLRENLTGIKVIKALGMTSYENSRFNERNKAQQSLEVKAGRIMAIVNPSMTLVMNIGLVAAIYFGGVRVNIGSMNIGEVVAFVNYFTMILNALLIITRIFISYTKARASAERINEVFHYQSTISNGDISLADIVSDEPLIEFKNVSFTYPKGEEPSLIDINFTLNKGETLAIIGGTGSGKSTITNLLMRFYDVSTGEICFKGINIRNIKLKDLRNQIALVLQRNFLFASSIEENIKWGKNNAPSDDVIKALEIAQASDFVNSLSDGLESRVAQGGSNFSGGQKQRLSIARAVIKDCECLILDDSSSALDYATDYKLRSSIRHNFADRSVIIIAQRISSVMYADKIVVLDDGKVVGYGTHNELVDNCGIYNEICISQLGGVLYV